MKTLILFSLCFHLLSFPAMGASGKNITLEGVVYKKGSHWFIYIDSKASPIRKGSLKLNGLDDSHRKYLKNQIYLKVIGQTLPCQGKYSCLKVHSIAHAMPNL